MKNQNMKLFIKYFALFFTVFTLLFFAVGLITEGTSKNMTFLMMGIDSKSFAESKGVRSDTIMLFNVDRGTGEISILSIPRDTRTPIEGRKNKEKINHSFAYGGPELTVKTVENLLGVDINHYVVVGFQVVSEYVDLIGGDRFNGPMDMSYSDPVADPPLKIDLKAGEQILDGDKALQYLRYRKGYKNADLGRIEAQQSFLKELIAQSAKPGIVLKIPGLYGIYNSGVNTDIPLTKLALYGISIFKYDLSNLISETLPGSPKTIDGISYYIHSEEKTAEIIQSMIETNNQ
ncbi:MAG TPA: LCP family protein [Gudongella oleilytica]|nr:LCP family protein [Gudongella oleilytica]